MPQSLEVTVELVKTALQERISQRSEAIKVPEISRQRSTVEQYLDVAVEVDKNVLPERVSERISGQGGVIEVPETASQDRRLQRTVVQYVDVFAEVDKNVFQERISEEMRDQISRKHLQCFFKLWKIWSTLVIVCAPRSTKLFVGSEFLKGFFRPQTV